MLPPRVAVLCAATIEQMVGHDDGGYLIATVYTKLAEHRALALAQRAMDAYKQRVSDVPYLRVVSRVNQ
jgi:hypothetical protein